MRVHPSYSMSPMVRRPRHHQQVPESCLRTLTIRGVNLIHRHIRIILTQTLSRTHHPKRLNLYNQTRLSTIPHPPNPLLILHLHDDVIRDRDVKEIGNKHYHNPSFLLSLTAIENWMLRLHLHLTLLDALIERVVSILVTLLVTMRNLCKEAVA